MHVDAATLSALLPFILVGFAAQLVDGALGMAFGGLRGAQAALLAEPAAQ